MMTDDKLAVTQEEDLWSDEICALVDAAFETVSRNPSDHESNVAYRRAIAQARLAGERAERGRAEAGWLIEERFGDAVHWIALSDEAWPRFKIKDYGRGRGVIERYVTPLRRVKDANDALRFARKQDAEAFLAMFGDFVIGACVTEHEWPAILKEAASITQGAEGDKSSNSVGDCQRVCNAMRGALASIIADPDCCAASKAIARDALTYHADSGSSADMSVLSEALPPKEPQQ